MGPGGTEPAMRYLSGHNLGHNIRCPRLQFAKIQLRKPGVNPKGEIHRNQNMSYSIPRVSPY